MSLFPGQETLLYKGRALWYFINEREKIRQLKESGAKRPWSKDAILNSYKFCCVFRRHDRVSRWLLDNWYTPNLNNENLWFSCVVARMINWPPTLKAIGYPYSWEPEKVYEIMDEIAYSGKKLFTGAYVLPTGKKGENKHTTITQILSGVWKNRVDLKPRRGDSLESAHTRFKRYPGFGDFLAFEVVLDWMETPILSNAKDRRTFAAIGPGSLGGLNRIFGRELDYQVGFDQALKEMRLLLEIADSANSPIGSHVERPLDLADIEGALCELRKYMSIQQDAKSRPLYVPHDKWE